MTETVKDQLQEIFRLVLEIDECQVSITPTATNIHVFRFKGNSGKYDVNVNGYWADWISPDHKESLENCIKNLKEIVG